MSIVISRLLRKAWLVILMLALSVGWFYLLVWAGVDIEEAKTKAVTFFVPCVVIPLCVDLVLDICDLRDWLKDR